jgi:hypothetical protein
MASLMRGRSSAARTIASTEPTSTARWMLCTRPKRLTEFLSRSLAAKHTVAAVAAPPADPASLATIEANMWEMLDRMCGIGASPRHAAEAMARARLDRAATYRRRF